MLRTIARKVGIRAWACGLLAGGLLPLLPTAAVAPRVGTPMSRTLDQLYGAAMRPLPPLPPPLIRTGDMAWVPDRYVPIPGAPEGVLVPGHWERRLDGDVHVPPLLGTTSDGRLFHLPGGVQPPVERRNGP